MAKQRSNSGRHTFFMCVLFLMATAAIVMSAIVLYRMLNEDDNKEATTTAPPASATSGAETGRSPTTPLPNSRHGAIVDCIPRNLREAQLSVTEGECTRRQ